MKLEEGGAADPQVALLEEPPALSPPGPETTVVVEAAEGVEGAQGTGSGEGSSGDDGNGGSGGAGAGEDCGGDAGSGGGGGGSGSDAVVGGTAGEGEGGGSTPDKKRRAGKRKAKQPAAPQHACQRDSFAVEVCGDHDSLSISATVTYDGGRFSHRCVEPFRSCCGSPRSVTTSVTSSVATSVTTSPQACGAFPQLLWQPEEVVRQMRPLGPPPGTGDGLVALPTMVHRGPGGNDAMATERSVLFFSIQPVFPPEKRAFSDEIGTYDPEAQIHGGWLLHRAGGVISEEATERILAS